MHGSIISRKRGEGARTQIHYYVELRLKGLELIDPRQ